MNLGQCCNPVGHHVSPMKITLSSLKKFRTVTSRMKEEHDVVLTEGERICSSCRLFINKNHQKTPPGSDDAIGNVRLQVVYPADQGVLRNSVRKYKTCCNPMGEHLKPRRCRPNENWYHSSGTLGYKMAQLNISVPENALVCGECRRTIYKRSQMKSFGKDVICADPLKRHPSTAKKGFMTSFKEAKQKYLIICSTLGLELQEGDYLCGGCRFRLKRSQPSTAEGATNNEDDGHVSDMDHTLNDITLSDSPGSPGATSEEDTDYFNEDVAKDTLQRIYLQLGMSLPIKDKLKSKEAVSRELDGLNAKLRSLFKSHCNVDMPTSSQKETCSSCVNYVEALSRKLNSVKGKYEKYLLLTSTPNWVSINKMISIFGVSSRLAENVSKLRKQSGPFSAPKPYVGKKLDEQVVTAVRDFYCHNDTSRVSPNQRDTVLVPVIVNGKETKERVAKREIMCTMRQLYTEFTGQHSDIRISISKFASLRPRECIWGFKKGFQRTCLCVKHTNFELLLGAIKVTGKTGELLQKCFCAISEDCMFGCCQNCPKYDFAETQLETFAWEQITCWQWTNSGHGMGIELQKVTQSADDYLLTLKKMIINVAEHHFIFEKQKRYITSLKHFENIDSNTAIIHADFGQNYSFVIPQEVQGFHWNNSQCTVHPFCFYFKENQGTDPVLKSFVVISDCLVHDSTTFHVFRVKVISKIKEMFPWINSIVYVTDGAGSQYKNFKNLGNLAFHFSDFGLRAKWVFSATSHGKDVVDAISAVAKRKTRLESLRRTDNYIVNAYGMYSYLSNHDECDKRQYVYVSADEIKTYVQETKLEERYSEFSTIPGTRKFHDVEVGEDNQLYCRRYSGATDVYTHNFRNTSTTRNVLRAEVGKFAAFIQSNRVFIGIVSEVKDDVVIMQMMRRCAKGSKYSWCTPEKLQEFNPTDLRLLLLPPTPTSSRARDYQFTSTETKALGSLICRGES